MIRILSLALLCISFVVSLTEGFVLQPSCSRPSTALYYRDEQQHLAVVQQPAEKPVVVQNKKPTIYPLSSLQELHDFLVEDDDRLTAIKFYAPWCTSCQRVGRRFQRLAMQRGDGVDLGSRKAITGDIRCAEIELGPGSTCFIHEQLQIKGLPHLQLYKGTTKLWAGSGYKFAPQALEKEIGRLLAMTGEELEASYTIEDAAIEN